MGTGLPQSSDRSSMRTRFFIPVLSLVACASLVVTSGSPASALSAKRNARFCADVSTMVSIPSVPLPTDTQFGTLLNALNTVDKDQVMVTRDAGILGYMANNVPSTQVRAWYLTAQSDALAEAKGLGTVGKNAFSLMGGQNSQTILVVASALSVASANAAAANTFIGVARSFSAGFCAKWPTPKPVK